MNYLTYAILKATTATLVVAFGALIMAAGLATSPIHGSLAVLAGAVFCALGVGLVFVP